jgi:hypothetical protein
MPYTAEQKAAWNDALNNDEQADLQAEADGKPRRRRGKIEIPAPKEPEVNPEIYRDVLPVLTKGFLMQAAEINGVLFVFKSLNHHEFEMVRLVGGYRADREPSHHFWDIFLAYGVFMVGGQNILLDRERAIPDVASTFSDLPRDAKQRVVRHLSELNRRASVATVLTEAYSTETYSRYRWSQVSGLDLMASTMTGIGGTDRIGLNYAQLTWRSLNYYQDLHDQMERDWENAKFIGSCFAGKGLQKVYNQDEDRRRKHKEEIVSRKDAIIRHALYGEQPTDLKQKGHAVMVAAQTTEELAAQLQKDLRGEKDWHDTVIEAHERHVRDNQAQQSAHLQSLIAERDVDFKGLSVVGGTDRDHPLSPAEVQERVTRRKQLMAQQTARQMVYPQLDEKLSKFYRKWGLEGDGQTPLQNPDIPMTVGTTDKPPSNVRPPPSRPTGTPFRR